MNETILNKKVSIERCLQQVHLYHALETGLPLVQDFLRQDAICMNLQRACERAIDIANLLIKRKKLGLPQTSRDSFALLQQAGLITIKQMNGLQAIVGFRNTLVHQYQALDLQVMEEVILHRLHELLDFADVALKEI